VAAAAVDAAAAPLTLTFGAMAVVAAEHHTATAAAVVAVAVAVAVTGCSCRQEGLPNSDLAHVVLVLRMQVAVEVVATRVVVFCSPRHPAPHPWAALGGHQLRFGGSPQRDG
jgi:hypothetical protein